ncbi:MAG: SIMPL domain-containing protein [Gemmatimonadales bacterium]
MKHKFPATLLAWVIFAPTTSTAQTQPADAPPEVLTTATGRVTLPPDRAILHFGVTIDDNTAALAAARNSLALQSVLDTLSALGFPAESLIRMTYTVQPQVDRQAGRKIVGYQSRAVIRLAIENLDRLGVIVDAALSAGATDVPNIRFESDQAPVARDSALAQAVRQARSEAETLATAAGTTLGRLLSISTGASYARAQQRLAFSGSASYAPVFDLNNRAVVIQVAVETRWTLQLTGR